MNIKFKPMPWLTGIVAIMLAILISLGVWQYQRLQWKTDLLAEVEASVTAPPLTSLSDLERAIAAEEPVDFRRIAFQAEAMVGSPSYHVFKSQQGGIWWDYFEPLGSSDVILFSSTASFQSKAKDVISDVSVGGEKTNWVGYVREDHPMGKVESWVKSRPNKEANRWFKFNQDGSWGYGLDVRNLILSHYIEIDHSISDAATLPVRRPTIRNNHRDYMLTWFSFAFLLIIFYLMIHRRAGRLSW